MDRIGALVGCGIGSAIGDALGAAVEFKAPGTFPPVTGYRGGGPHPIQPGMWTDDTSMAIASAESLIVSEGFHPGDHVARWLDWRDAGAYSPIGRCFDIGGQTNRALSAHGKGEPVPGGERTCGNGSLMRMAPFVAYYQPCVRDPYALDAMIKDIREASALTHPHPYCTEACAALVIMCALLADGAAKEYAIRLPDAVLDALQPIPGDLLHILCGQWRYKSEPGAGAGEKKTIKGDGFVLNTLEAAIWAFATTETFEACVLKAVNLGDDADTTACVAGMLAGSYYGYRGIPQPLIAGLYGESQLRALYLKLCSVAAG